MILRILLALVSAVPFFAQVPASHRDIKFPPLNPIKIPQVDRSTLANGLTLFLVEDHELPTVRAQALIRTGDRWEPLEKAGLADITVQVMRTGGTPARSGDALDKELDRLAASVELGASSSSSNASVFVLKEDSARGLGILADILRNPAFPQDKIELAKTELRDTISRRNDQPMSIHGRESSRLLYGKSSPYTRQAEYATLDSIARDDLIAFHKQFFQPENVILAVWGDFKAAEMKALVATTFGAWPRGGKPKPATPSVDVATQARGLHLIKKDDVNQSNLGISFLLGRQDDPDYHALYVMTNILGGGFGSRMTTSIRENAGLAYMAGAGYSAGFDHPGAWSARVGTKSESTIQALELMRKEIARIKEAEVTDEEIQRSKDGILKGEAFDYDSTAKIVTRLMALEYYGYPADHLQRFRAGIDRVTKADVLRVSRRYLDESRFLTLVLGNPAKFDKPLSSLGPLTEVDITIPAPKAAAVAEATAETEAKGRALLARARQAHGGAAIDKVRDYSAKLDMTMVTPQGEMAIKSESTVNLEGKSLMKMILPFGEMQQGFDGQAVWMKTPQGIQQMPASMADAARLSTQRDVFSLLRNYNKPGYKVQALGSSKLDNKDVEGVRVANDALKLDVKLFLDPSSGLLSGKTYMGQAMTGAPGEITEILSDFRDVDGLKIAFRSVSMNAGRRVAEAKINEMKINPGVPDSAYAKPAQ